MALNKILLALILFLAAIPELYGQSLTGKLNAIFRNTLSDQISGGENMSLLSGFAPEYVASNAMVIEAFSSLLTANISTYPLTSSMAGLSFDFKGGMPIASVRSMGPVFAERGQTSGKGRFNAGFNYSYHTLDNIRGLNASRISFSFVHQDLQQAGLGDQIDEFDSIDMDLLLDIDASVMQFSGTFGLTNRLDIGIVLPYVRVTMQTQSRAHINSMSYLLQDRASYYYDGSAENPVLSFDTPLEISEASGLGDLAVRGKYNITRSPHLDIAALLEWRLDTGDAQNFLGAGQPSFRLGFISSAVAGNIAPHINLSYVRRSSRIDADEVDLVMGYDQFLSDRFTLAVDFLGRFEIADTETGFPGPTAIQAGTVNGVAPISAVILPTNLPRFNRDHIATASFGLKYSPREAMRLVGNLILPLNNGGVRSRLTSTVGMEFSF